MKIGVGLPFDDSRKLLEWARLIDAGPFSSIGFADRLVYHNPEVLVILAGAAAVTRHVRLMTEVLLAPTRSAALLAKQCATVDQLSGGRFTLGLGLGPRRDDYAATGADFRSRGRTLEQHIRTLRRVWAGDPLSAEAGPIGPNPTQDGGPEILLGGRAPRALVRAGRLADGFLSSSGLADTNDQFRLVEETWENAGRPGAPRLVAQVNVVLGTGAQVAAAREAVRRYYNFLPDAAARAAAVLSTPDAIANAVEQYAGIGADELVLYPWSTNLDQVDRFADLVS